MGSCKINRALITAVAILVILMCQSSSARLLCGSFPEVGASLSSAGIALPMEQKNKMGREGSVVTAGGTKDKNDYYYKSLLLNVLPKGSRAPSGPSKRTNSLVN